MNSKRKRRNRLVTLGRYRLTFKDIRNIERIILKHLKTSKPKDFYLEVGKTKYRGGLPETATIDSIRWLPQQVQQLTYLTIRSFPDFYIEFTPFKTRIGSKRIFFRGKELAALDKTSEEVAKYIKEHGKQSIINIIVKD